MDSSHSLLFAGCTHSIVSMLIVHISDLPFLYFIINTNQVETKCMFILMYCGVLMCFDSKAIETVRQCISTFCDALKRVGGGRVH